MWWTDSSLNNATAVGANSTHERTTPGQGTGLSAKLTGFRPDHSPFGYSGEAYLSESYGAPPIPDILFTVAGWNNAPLRGQGP